MVKIIMTVKRNWQDMIASGIKKEECRRIKDYWTVRFRNALGALLRN